MSGSTVSLAPAGESTATSGLQESHLPSTDKFIVWPARRRMTYWALSFHPPSRPAMVAVVAPSLNLMRRGGCLAKAIVANSSTRAAMAISDRLILLFMTVSSLRGLPQAAELDVPTASLQNCSRHITL